VIGNEYDELLNHRIEVTDKALRNDFGVTGFDPATTRTYMCLVTHSEGVTRTATETSVGVTLVAYVKPIPVDGTEPVAIPEDSQVKITVPSNFPNRPVTEILTYYDSDGTDYAYEVRFGSGRVPIRG